LKIYNPGIYEVTVYDKSGYYRASGELKVDMDYFSTYADLGLNVSVCYGDSIYLQVGYDEARRYSWNTGDTLSKLPIYNEGNYKLTVSSINGCVATDEVYVNIQGSLPVPNFDFDTVCIGKITHFYDKSTISKFYDSNDTIVDYYWQFGDGKVSTEVNPFHIYSEAGVYNVKLSVKSINECANAITKNVRVLVLPQINFGFNIPFINDTI